MTYTAESSRLINKKIRVCRPMGAMAINTGNTLRLLRMGGHRMNTLYIPRYFMTLATKFLHRETNQMCIRSTMSTVTEETVTYSKR